VVSFTPPVALPSAVRIDRRLGGPQSLSGRSGGKKSCPFWELNLGHPPCSVVTIMTELPRFEKEFFSTTQRNNCSVISFVAVDLCVQYMNMKSSDIQKSY
jgi:hypothetical protein